LRELQIIYEHGGIKEIKYTAEENSDRALELIEEVLTLQNQFKNTCPYSLQFVEKESTQAETVAFPEITDIEQVALRELKLQDTIDDIKNEEISRNDLWRSAFICGGIAIRDKIKSNFPE
jgi:hypothetical protein